VGEKLDRPSPKRGEASFYMGLLNGGAYWTLFELEELDRLVGRRYSLPNTC